MVRHGFSLEGVRQLYLDEVVAYFEELVILLEAEGVLKKGVSARLSRASTIDQLRTQIKTLKRN